MTRLRVRVALPGSELERPRGAAIAIGGVIALALIVSMRIAMLEHTVGDYQISEIVHCFDVMYVEAIVIALFVRRRGGSAVDRCALIVLVGMALLLPLLAIFSSHTDLVHHVVVTWHLLLGGWLVAFAIVGAIVQRVRARLPDVRPPMPRPRGWQVPAAGIALLAIVAAYETAVLAREPPGYLRHWYAEHGGTWIYPTHVVYVAIAMMIAETGYAAIALAARGTVTLRARLVLVAAAALCGGLAATAAPAPVSDVLAIWHVCVMVWLLTCGAALIVIAIARVLIERHERPF